MPVFTAIFWNIQDMGNNGRYRHYPSLMNFIAAAALAQEADVVALMELRRIGVNQLGALQDALNAAYNAAGRHNDWHFDWIPAAINSRVANHVMPTLFAQLGWETKANGEGYAVFWNNDPARLLTEASPTAMSGGVNMNLARTGPQSTVPAFLVPAHVLRLVLEGRDGSAPPFQYDDSDLPNAAPMPPEAYERLDFLTNISNKPLRAVTRRPCYCVFRLKDGFFDAGTLVSLLVFHAPGVIKFRQVAAVATRLFSFSRPLYNVVLAAAAGVAPDRVAAGGDLNLNTDDGPEYLLPAIEGFTNPRNDAGVPGAACEQLAPAGAASNSTVRLATGAFGMMGDPILDADADAYRAYAIDNVFHRGFDAPDDPIGGPGPEPPIYDLISAVMAAGNPFEAAIQSFAQLFWDHPPGYLDDDTLDDILNPDRDPPPAVQVDGDFLAGLVQGWFPTARSAAEFVRLLISDHLPVVFRGHY